MNEKLNNYEGMFLLDAGAGEFEAVSQPIVNALSRSEAQILSLKPWDERRLAYEIRGRKRGLYVLAYFKVAPLKVAEIEHTLKLDERVLRSLILYREVLTEEEINAQTPATGAPVRVPEIGEREETEGYDRPRRAPHGADRDIEVPELDKE